MYNLGLRRTYFSLFRALFGRVPPETAPEGQRVWGSCIICKDVLLKAQPIPVLGKSNQHGRAPARMNQGLLMEFKSKRKCTEGRSGGESTETTAPVSETLENTARTQRITIHCWLFLSQEKAIFSLKSAFAI